MSKLLYLDDSGVATLKTLIGQPTDTQVASAVDTWLDEHPEATTTVQDGAVTTAKLADGAVTDAKLVQTGGVLEEVHDIRAHTKKKEPVNLLEGVGVTQNKRWFANSSSTEYASGFNLSDLIPVEGNTYYCMIGIDSWDKTGYVSGYFAQFDENGQIILQDNNGYGWRCLTSSNTRFVRVTYNRDHEQYASQYPVLTKGAMPYKTEAGTIELVDVYSQVTSAEVAFTYKNTQYENLLESHRNSLVDSMVVSNGNMVANANFISLSDYISCEPSTTYSYSLQNQDVNTTNPTVNINWYDSTGQYISNDMHANNTSFTSPENAAYFRISIIRRSSSNPKGSVDFSEAYLAKCDMPYGPPAVDMQKTYDGIFPQTSMQKKKWTVFGDSITEKNVRASANYHDYIRAETGVTIVNKGVGGSGYKTRWQNDNAIFQLAESSVAQWSDSDVITCMAGINDAWSEISANLGTYADVYDEDSTAQNQSVMSCFNHFLDIIQDNAPLARIGIISPIPCYHTSGSTLYDFRPDNDDCDIAKLIVECKESCRRRGIPYLDLFHESGLRPWESAVNEAMFKTNAADSPDGLHPNHVGHRYLYPMIREFVKSLV